MFSSLVGEIVGDMASRKGAGSKKRAGSDQKRGFSKAEKVAIPIIIIIAVWVVYSLAQPSPSSTTLSVTYSSSLSQSGVAPDFTLPVVGSSGLTGQTVTLSSFRGKVVLLEFMEPWCPHCQHMAPVLDGLYAQYGAGNVVFISVEGNWEGATANDGANFIRTYGTNWIYAYDSSGTVFANYGVQATPTFFIIGKDGSISSSFSSGELTSDTLAAAISAAANG